MSDTNHENETVDAPVAVELPVSFQAFAVSLRPQPRRDASGRPVAFETPGHPDEIWLKFIGIKHGIEKHSITGWMGLIDHYRNLPAHTSGKVN